ncbi:cobalamin-binding protein [Halorhodospira halochloris]|uniref:cobalamin-binding protein n=1 Tax=Halorhodospira halochloris TaxID=1052 RepID=UPI001EE960D7|nr:cobalamin-binding protein [Halorhodospira halochloris]MCG5549137.1 cobalamin-binding protein [Halorhodospira halochloris]
MPIYTKKVIAALSLALLMPLTAATGEEICATDDTGQEVCLDEPAQRIVALSPGVTELLYAAGAGANVVAAVSHADYPGQAQDLPRVGSYNRLDVESILAKQPDLAIGWHSGNSPGQLDRLEELGVKVYRSEQRDLEDIPSTLERFGKLAGSSDEAQAEADEFRVRRDELEQRYAEGDNVEVFYQVWDDPITTINDEQIISEVIRLCGGSNVFGHLERLTPRLDTESVLAADPQAIVVGGMGEANQAWLDHWREYERMTAVQQQNLFFVPPSKIQRPTPRLLEGAAKLCEQLEKAR